MAPDASAERDRGADGDSLLATMAGGNVLRIKIILSSTNTGGAVAVGIYSHVCRCEVEAFVLIPGTFRTMSINRRETQ